MTREGWKDIVYRAVRLAGEGEPEALDLLSTLLFEQDQAKAKLSEMGFGVPSTPWLKVVEEIRLDRRT